MIELVRQEDDETCSPFRELYAKDQEGLHHTAVFVSDFEAGVTEFAASGLPLATRCETSSGVCFGFIDALSSMGHFIEIYENSPTLLGFYKMISDAAENWDESALFINER